MNAETEAVSETGESAPKVGRSAEPYFLYGEQIDRRFGALSPVHEMASSYLPLAAPTSCAAAAFSTSSGKKTARTKRPSFRRSKPACSYPSSEAPLCAS